MTRGLESSRVNIPEVFKSLEAEFCSIGQTQEYYENLMHLDEPDRIAILDSLRDAVWSPAIYEAFRGQHAFGASLLRSISPAFVEKYRDVLHLRARETPFHFSYLLPCGSSLDFRVAPRSRPPSNIHAVIGKNGAGKTRLLNSISALLQDGPDTDGENNLGRILFHETDGAGAVSQNSGFANLVTVSFSAFDDFTPQFKTIHLASVLRVISVK